MTGLQYHAFSTWFDNVIISFPQTMSWRNTWSVTILIASNTISDTWNSPSIQLMASPAHSCFPRLLVPNLIINLPQALSWRNTRGVTISHASPETGLNSLVTRQSLLGSSCWNRRFPAFPTFGCQARSLPHSLPVLLVLDHSWIIRSLLILFWHHYWRILIIWCLPHGLSL